MRQSRFLALALLIVLALVASCDSPTDPTAGQVAGVVILNAGGSQVARFLDDGTVSGGLTAEVGSTATYHVRVLTASGSTIPLDSSIYSIRNAGVVIGFRATIGIDGDRLLIAGLQPGPAGTIHFQLFEGAAELFQVEGISLEVR